MRTIKREIVGTFIFSNDEYVLLGLSRKGGVYKDQWIVPGGGIEEGETKLQAAIREANEEVGIDLSKYKLELLDYVSSGESLKTLRDTGEQVLVKMTFYDYVAKINKKASEIKVNCTDDLAVAKWFSRDDLKQINIANSTKDILGLLGYL